jgi:hypothetical protein
VVITDAQGQQTTHQSDDPRPLYAIEADHMGALIQAGAQASDLVSPDFSINTAYWLDRWREAAGVSYDADQLGDKGFNGDSVSLGAHGQMPLGKIAGLDKPISKLVLGTDNQTDGPTMAAMADAFVEAGGTCFDTAHIYSGGLERDASGPVDERPWPARASWWLLARARTRQIATPTPSARSWIYLCDRLQTDYLDIYCLHRDNPDVPVGQWIDTAEQ